MRKNKKYYLFVSYNFQTENGWGFGNNTTFYSNKKYVSNQEIREMENEICELNKYKNVVIMSYQFIQL